MMKQIIFQLSIRRFLPFAFFLILTSHGYAADKNLAKYRIVSHSSSADANHCGHLVVDGSLDTYWEGYRWDKNQSLVVDLGSPRVINQLVIHWGSNYATSYSISLLVEKKGERIELLNIL